MYLAEIMTNNVSHYNIFTLIYSHMHSSGFAIIEQDESFTLLHFNTCKHEGKLAPPAGVFKLAETTQYV